ncbi:hypothetical protein F5884DRAFT_215080 [Xylogone sp. PMI_703]|nr:hypothetical protein F5884DRAFT_215080 [Xylogone sp. PMI_703]
MISRLIPRNLSCACRKLRLPLGFHHGSSRAYSSSVHHHKLDSLKGKKVLITGASKGIGAEIARSFALEGAQCVLVGRNSEKLQSVMESLAVKHDNDTETPNDNTTDRRNETTCEHSLQVGDVGTRSFWETIVKDIGDLDILVNAAGVTQYSALFATKPELIEELLHTNLQGTIWGCQIFGKKMLRRRDGCIINVASLLGIKGGKGSTVYAASKAGVIGLTRALAVEMGPSNIRVNAILPGYIETGMTLAMTPEARAQALAAIPLKRFGDVQEVAGAALFLATNKYASNCVLNLDGGLSAT